MMIPTYKEMMLKNLEKIIQNDILNLVEAGSLSENIMVSIPTFLLNIICPNEMHKTIFGCVIVPGYNNQICVFDNMADNNSKNNHVININI